MDAFIVRGSPQDIARAFGRLVPLQPVRWDDRGLIVAPAFTDAPETHAFALEQTSLDINGYPDPPARFVSGFYVRSPFHASAPPGIPEIVQAPGGAFGPGGHVTTEMCLQLIRLLPDGATVDVGCGSGILSIARAHLCSDTVFAIDPDPEAVRQARVSVAASHVAKTVTIRAMWVSQLSADDLAERVIMANLPHPGHLDLLERTDEPPKAVLLSGLHRSAARDVVHRYRRIGLRSIAALTRGRWECWLMTRESRPRRT